MPIPLAVGRLNRVGFNRLSIPFAARLPGFGVVHHRGRRSGRAYRTPVNVFPVDDGFVIALTYGPRADWVRNVVVAGGLRIETRGRLHDCTEPYLYRDPERTDVPAGVAVALRALGVEDFLRVRG
jgi:deazaflavin-dependent oxidoreductase (nitroreductase family)